MWSEDYCGHSRKLRVKKHPTLRSGGCINKMYEKNYYSVMSSVLSSSHSVVSV